MSTPTTSRGRGRRSASTAADGAKRDPRPPYELKREPDGRAWTVRENITDILERELLGPAGEDDEVLDGPPDAAYLVGRIAPVKLTAGKDDPVAAGVVGAPTDVGDAHDARQGRGVPVTAVDDSTASGDDDAVDGGSLDSAPQRGLMIPASMGLRFQVPADQAEVKVRASWGVYEPVRGTEEDRLRRRHRRTPVRHSQVVRLADLEPSTTKAYPLVDAVVLRVDSHHEEARSGSGPGRILVDVALCNDRETPRTIPTNAWMYQTRLDVDAGGAAVFLPVNDVLLDGHHDEEEEVRRLDLQYRDRLEFAVGRTCSADWGGVDPLARRAAQVRTTWLPVCETPQTGVAPIPGALLDMRTLAEASTAELTAGLRPIVEGYGAWLDEQAGRAEALPDHLCGVGQDAVADAQRVHDQLVAGVEHLLSDDEALRCFRFMNRVMADQRVHSQITELRAATPMLSVADATRRVAEKKDAHSWRAFQLAFVLMQLPALSDPAAAARSGSTAAAQLLFFPTGGGKTEAYLGLAAYTFAVRRRQGLVGSAGDEVDGGAGVAVIMRYTLRLLTSQQFQRATTLVCAAELARREDESTWGAEPFRIGLWVGSDASPKRYDEAVKQLEKFNAQRTRTVTALQVERCPWCGTPITPRDVTGDDTTRRITVHCGDTEGRCPFSLRGTGHEGLPVLTVDEEIYRLAPAFVIATVDKFARLAREGEAGSLFGRVARRCARHGFVHPDYPSCEIRENGRHPAKDGHPAAAVRPARRLRPPDLIIQDELHLITGSLGTSVGLFEVAVDVLCSWTDAEGREVRPLVVASSATVRSAAEQVKALYGRDLTIFPPQVLDAGSTFFSVEEKVSEHSPGRRYVGISTTGVRLTSAEIRVAEVLMAAGQLVLDREEDRTDADEASAADPYLTLVGYFGATRELAGMKRYLGDDVQTALRKRRPWSLLPARTGTDYGSLEIGELTSRASSRDINATLDRMGVPFDKAVDGTVAKRAAFAAGARTAAHRNNPYDVVLATSMLQVGVDVSRLGLMLMVGQPKNTAEYIQASSRVGRSSSRPGLVVGLGNWARPRDLAHFEQFRHYHETFYARVETLSVTPFSVTSLERGLDGALVSAARAAQADRTDGLSPERNAGRVGDERARLDELVDALCARIERASDDEVHDLARQRLTNAVEQWVKRRDRLRERSQRLVYERTGRGDEARELLISPENARAHAGRNDHQPPFRVANSMREVQPEVNVLVSPIPENLYTPPPPTAPRWVMPESEDGR